MVAIDKKQGSVEWTSLHCIAHCKPKSDVCPNGEVLKVEGESHPSLKSNICFSWCADADFAPSLFCLPVHWLHSSVQISKNTWNFIILARFHHCDHNAAYCECSWMQKDFSYSTQTTAFQGHLEPRDKKKNAVSPLFIYTGQWSLGNGCITVNQTSN